MFVRCGFELIALKTKIRGEYLKAQADGSRFGAV
jgi:hypothetical protein